VSKEEIYRVDTIFLLGTILFWVGLGYLLKGVVAAVSHYIFKVPDLDGKAAKTAVMAPLGLAFGLLGQTLAFAQLDKKPQGFAVPAAWVYMPFWGWVAAVSITLAAIYGLMMSLGLTQEERNSRAQATAIWGISAVISIILFRQFGGEVTIFKGVFYPLPESFSVAVAAIFAVMLWREIAKTKRASNRKSMTALVHATLLVGCVIFGLPFAWLLSGSLKEDRDHTGGIKWVPRLTMTHEYMDPERPQFESKFQGQTVVADLIEKQPDGDLKLDIIQPFSLRGQTFEAPESELKKVPRKANVVSGEYNGAPYKGFVAKDLENGDRVVQFLEPESLKGQTRTFKKKQAEDLRPVGARWQNYPDALQYMPPETGNGMLYFTNTVVLIALNIIGTLFSCSLVAYAFSRLNFPAREILFKILLATMMLPGAVTLLPQFLIFKSLGWIDTIHPLWVPAFFASAFNVFMLRQFFSQIPTELEDAAKIDGCSYFQTFWRVILPQVKPALAVIAIWTFMGTWNNFMGPLIYINSPEKMPIAYALQLFASDRGGEPSLQLAFSTMTMLPVLALFFFAQKYFIEGVSLSGLGGR
jgi:multiple sugar transport system permease protein